MPCVRFDGRKTAFAGCESTLSERGTRRGRLVDGWRGEFTSEVSGMQRRSANPSPIGGVGLDEEERHKALQRYGFISPLLAAVHRGERSRRLGELAEMFGDQVPSRATLYRYLQRYHADNLEGLVPRRRADAGVCRAIPRELQEQIVDLVRRSPWLSTPVLIAVLKAENPVVDVAPATVNRLLRAQGMRAEQQELRRYKNFRVERPQELWMGDAAQGPELSQGEGRPKLKTSLLINVDAFSRTIVAARYYPRQNQLALDDLLLRSILAFGLPTTYYVDNGGPYVSDHLREVLARLGVQLRHAPVYSPASKGRVERLISTTKSQCQAVLLEGVRRGDYTTLADLNAGLDTWVHEIYNRRPHSVTRLAPIELHGKVEPYPEPERLREIFLWTKRRKVTKTGTISLMGATYRLPEDIRTLWVSVRFDPFDLTRVYIEEETQLRPAPVLGAPPQPADVLSYLEPRSHPRPKALPEESPAQAAARLLTELLGRPLTPSEQVIVDNCPLPATQAVTSHAVHLREFVREHGADLHLSTYLAILQGGGVQPWRSL